MTINILVYGIFSSIKERRNMFPTIVKQIESKSSIFNNDYLIAKTKKKSSKGEN